MPSGISSASAKRKQDEKHYNLLKELLAQDCNKKCFDCGQRGPVYVNMTIGAFVCTACSGLLRGMSTPHRVKSVSMASFTPEEMEFIQKHGNDACYCIWMGRYEAKYGTDAFPESKEEHKLRDFLHKKYEQKVWYVSEAKALAEYEEVRKKREAATVKEASTKTVSKTPVPVPLSSRDPKTGNKVSIEMSKPAPPVSKPVDYKSSNASNNQNDLDMILGGTPSPNSTMSSGAPNMAGNTAPTPIHNDPFASSSVSPNSGGFDLFASFSSASNQTDPPGTLPAGLSVFAETTPAQNAQHSAFNADFSQMSLNPQPVTKISTSPAQQPSGTQLPAAKPQLQQASVDKYAVLASLDEEIKSSSNKLSWSDQMTTVSAGDGAGNFGMSNNSTGYSNNFWSGNQSANGFSPRAPNSMGQQIPNGHTQPNMGAPPNTVSANPFASGSANPFADPKWNQFPQTQSTFPSTNVGMGPNFTAPATNNAFGNFQNPNSGFVSSGGVANGFGQSPQSQHTMQYPYQNINSQQQPFGGFSNANQQLPSLGSQSQTPFGGFTAFPNSPQGMTNSHQMPGQGQFGGGGLIMPQMQAMGSAIGGLPQQQQAGMWSATVAPGPNMQSGAQMQSNGSIPPAGPDPFASLASGFKSSNFSQFGAVTSTSSSSHTAVTQWPNQSGNFPPQTPFTAATPASNVKANPFMD